MAGFDNAIYVANDIKIMHGANNVRGLVYNSGTASNGGNYIILRDSDRVIYYNSTANIYRFKANGGFYDGQKITIIGPNAKYITPRPSSYTQVDGSISQHSKATTGQSIELMYYNGQWYTKEYTE